jgi:hypothetical protein
VSFMKYAKVQWQNGMCLKSSHQWFGFLMGLILLMTGCTADPTQNEATHGAITAIDDLIAVDCLLPGQMIQQGQNTQWLSSGRPARIPAWECKVQGGQYAVGSSALQIWLESAKQGDKVAQNYVGEIYESGFGVKPDYGQAAEWFRKSADQGYDRAQNNLGFLYEKGLGVSKNSEIALSLYRKASGLVDPIRLDQSTKAEITELRVKLNQAEDNIKELQQQLKDSQQLLLVKQNEVDGLKAQGTSNLIQAQLKDVQKELEETSLREQKLRQQIADSQQELLIYRGKLGKTENSAALGDMPNMGNFYALIIGINKYDAPLSQLKTPVDDAKKIEAILRTKYGFNTQLIIDDSSTKPTEEGIIRALVDLTKKLKEDDNLLIYFAGHGEIRSDRYHWLPQDAASDNPSNWISTDDITKEIETTEMKAKHVLIVADSCYAAALVTRSISDGIASESPENRVGWIKKKADLISRSALTSGGLEPVLDQDGGNGLSIFANALLEALTRNEGIIGANDIYRDIGPEVSAKSVKYGGNQTPVYARIPGAGDSNGEFFFVPQSKQGKFQQDKLQLTFASRE